MAITEHEADELESGFLEAEKNYSDYSIETARKVIAAWDKLIKIMERENNMSDQLGVKTLDWQIGNWANDTSLIAHNSGLYDEEIRVNEQILKIHWSQNEQLYHENARRDIADAYEYMGNLEKCYQLYDQYLRDDPMWGWAWIGYYRILHNHNDERFEQVLDKLYTDIKAGVEYRDIKDLYRELGDEYEELGNEERTRFFRELEEAENEKHHSQSVSEWLKMPTPVLNGTKIYPNDPCPCGSGKKYKKCCGKNN